MRWYFIILIIALVLLLFIGAIKRRWKRKHNEKLTIKQLFKRWKKGIDGVTPRGIAVSQLLGAWILVTGFVFGLVTALFLVFGWKAEGAVGFIVNRPVWFLIVISASFLLSILSLISALQKYHRTKKIDETKEWIQNKDLMKKIYEERESGKSFKQIKKEMKIKKSKLRKYYNRHKEVLDEEKKLTNPEKVVESGERVCE